jgi:hypothetical protein
MGRAVMRDSISLLLGLFTDDLTNEKVRQRMTEAGTSAFRLMDEQVQQNMKFFETILFNFNRAKSETKGRETDPKA